MNIQVIVQYELVIATTNVGKRSNGNAWLVSFFTTHALYMGTRVINLKLNFTLSRRLMQVS